MKKKNLASEKMKTNVKLFFINTEKINKFKLWHSLKATEREHK